MSNEPTVKRWTAKRKAAVVMDIFKGKTTTAEVARQYDLTVSEVEGWIDEAQRSMENGFKADESPRICCYSPHRLCSLTSSRSRARRVVQAGQGTASG
ncbi:DUF1153 domain-containing protein [Halomonas piscis]|uniref:DUF1153 domain-containing protein n=1 Tax=Halomonas piscis TaxID=3031727 RepID=UPI00289E565B|nr:DUF1153 domain-containing protein [Halomonas piscis]